MTNELRELVEKEISRILNKTSFFNSKEEAQKASIKIEEFLKENAVDVRNKGVIPVNSLSNDGVFKAIPLKSLGLDEK